MVFDKQTTATIATANQLLCIALFSITPQHFISEWTNLEVTWPYMHSYASNCTDLNRLTLASFCILFAYCQYSSIHGFKVRFSAQCLHERAHKKSTKTLYFLCWIVEQLFPHHLALIKVTPGLKTLTFPSRPNSMCKWYKSQQAKIQWKSGWETCAHLSLSLYSLSSHIWNNPESRWQEHSIHVWVQRAHLTSQALIKT